MTSLNAVVIGIRLVVSLFIQRLLAEMVGEVGISKIGQLRNLTSLLTSLSTGGIFNGVTKYVSEFKDDKGQLQKNALTLRDSKKMELGIGMYIIN